MSILQEMIESLQSDSPCYIDFLYRYNPKKKQVFAFYEGEEDSSFYHNILKSVISSDCELEEIVAGCKNNIIKLQREFDWKSYNNKQIIFFVDRDLSYWLGDASEYGENIFVTDGYSVENYVANSKGFEFWLLHFEGFARATKQELNYMISEYETNERLFKEAMMPIMAKAVVAKKHDCSVVLNDFKLTHEKNIKFNMNGGHITFNILEDDRIAEKWKLDSENNKEIDEQLSRFSLEKENYSVRGKWYLFFMAEVGEFMRLNSNLFAPSLGRVGKINPTCAVLTTQCLSVLAPYFVNDVPIRLREFLNDTYISFLQ